MRTFEPGPTVEDVEPGSSHEYVVASTTMRSNGRG
jgi:hypothetical protein